MREEKDGIQYSHGVRSDIRVPVIAVIGLVLSLSGVIYGQLVALDKELQRRFETHQSRCSTRWDSYEKRIDEKADKRDADDRYTGKQAAERRQAVDQRFDALEKANIFAHESLVREIDHIHDIMRESNECR